MAAGESRDPESDNTLSNQTDEDNDFEISEMAEDAKSVLRRSLGSWRRWTTTIRGTAALGRTAVAHLRRFKAIACVGQPIKSLSLIHISEPTRPY